MAEVALFSVAQGILNTLCSQLQKEIGLLWGVKDEFQRFQHTVSTIQDVLLDAEDQSAASNQVRGWLRQLREAMNDAENLLDDVSFEALRRKVMLGNKVSKEVRLFLSRSNQLVLGRKMAHRIKDMRTRLDEIAATSQTFRFVERRLERHVVPEGRRQTHSHPPQGLVGRDGDRDVIVELLLSGEYKESVGVVPIVGIGGLGKTTLAQLVFNHERVEAHFEMRMWICVADTFDVKTIVKKIIGSTSKEIDGDTEMNLLVDMLHKNINGKRYLLVLDDVWNEEYEKWSRLKDLLSSGAARESRIIVTTRLANVAEMIRPIKVHNLQGLSNSDSWSLFALNAFKGGEVHSTSHRKIGEEIVEKCSGVPLAIKVIGSLLYNRTIHEWSSFKSKELLTVGRGEGSIFSILKISYDHLPSYLKHCFAYCCLFPKDHVINVLKLINLWMAQGYLNQESSSNCLEDIGLDYFMELLWRSFFQDVTTDDLGNIRTCKMHDLMHDLARQVAGSNIVVPNPRGEILNKKTRHVSFSFDPTEPWKLPISLLDAKDVRTFFLLHDAKDAFESECIMDKKQWRVFSYKLRRLRSLDLHSSKIFKVPRSISKLKHLRELDISYNVEIRLLPDSITELYNLQVLRLESCSKLIELPKSTYQLIKLSQLDLTGCSSLQHMPCGLGQLTSLHMLTMFVVTGAGSSSFKKAADLNELLGMNDLRGLLEICNLGTATSNVTTANLKAKEHLEHLILDWSPPQSSDDTAWSAMGEDEMTKALEALEPHQNLKKLQVSFNQGSKFPKWLSSLTNLTKIVLSFCRKCQYIPPLHQLPYLRFLSIWGLDALEFVDSEDTTTVNASSSSSSSSSFFPSLAVLRLSYCSNLKGWWRRPPPTSTMQLLPRLHLLSELVIWNCPNLALMPLFPPLKSLEFESGSFKSLQDIWKATAIAEHMATSSASAASSSSSLSVALSQLQELTISHIEDVEFLPEELLCHMGSLKVLRIKSWYRLKALGPAVGYLTSLETLELSFCTSLNLLQDHHPWQALGCLRNLTLESVDLVSLPTWLQHLQALQELKIKSCNSLMSLPDWLVHQLPSLQRLTIYDCPRLSRRCRTNDGPDWPFIAHIPNIKVDQIVVQRNGRYLLV